MPHIALSKVAKLRQGPHNFSIVCSSVYIHRFIFDSIIMSYFLSKSYVHRIFQLRKMNEQSLEISSSLQQIGLNTIGKNTLDYHEKVHFKYVELVTFFVFLMHII